MKNVKTEKKDQSPSSYRESDTTHMITKPRRKDHTGAPPDLNANQRDIMSAIKHLGGSPHGAAIKEFLGQFEDDGEFASGVLYPGLDSLINKGILDKRKRDGRSNDYFFTSYGEEVYRDYALFVVVE